MRFRSGLVSIEWLLLIGGLVVLGSFVAYSSFQERLETERYERDRLSLQAKVVHDNLIEQLASVDRALLSARDELGHWDDPVFRLQVLNRRLKAFSDVVPGIRTMTLIDAQGVVRAGNRTELIGRDFGERAYFQVPKAHPQLDILYVSPPFETVLGVWAMNLVRVVKDEKGEFQGVVSATLDPDAFRAMLGSVRYAPEMWVAIAHGEGLQFMMEPERPDQGGKNLAQPGSFFSRHRASGLPAEVLEGVVYATGEHRMMALRTVQPPDLHMDKPLVVAVGRTVEAIYDKWSIQSWKKAGLFLLLALFSCLGLAIHQRRRGKSEAEFRLAAAAFETQEAIVITDPDGVILRVNQAFTEITGYQPEELIGQNPRILKSARHDAAFYRHMWEALILQGHWHGEIWDRRKNGEEYPKLLTITAVKDEHGHTTHYVGTHIDISANKAAEERIVRLAYFDSLTGLHNRTSFHDFLQRAIGQAQRGRRRLALLLIDLDGFKMINDTMGHQAGDKLLVTVATRLKDEIRHSDFAARLGGDEFVIVLPDVDTPSDAANVAGKLVAVLSEPCQIDGQELRTSPSIGICLYPEDAPDADDLIKKADVAMYHAKANGRANYQFFRNEFQDLALKRLAIEADLRVALNEGQFVLYYQPQLDLRTGQLCGVEALLRWRHPSRGLVPPMEFVGIAEETGLIKPIGDWVIAEACRQVAAWKKSGLDHITMSINLAASQFSDPELPGRLKGKLDAEGLGPNSLHFELTESMTMANPGEAAVMMKRLVDLGINLSVDDFGTGYSSLAYLKQFPISTLKIDRSFVSDLETDSNDAEICDVTVLLGHKLGLELVAEGVETEAQLKFMLSIGCEKIQGYLISRPLPAVEAEAFIRQWKPLSSMRSVVLFGDSEVVA